MDTMDGKSSVSDGDDISDDTFLKKIKREDRDVSGFGFLPVSLLSVLFKFEYRVE